MLRCRVKGQWPQQSCPKEHVQAIPGRGGPWQCWKEPDFWSLRMAEGLMAVRGQERAGGHTEWGPGLLF